MVRYEVKDYVDMMIDTKSLRRHSHTDWFSGDFSLIPWLAHILPNLGSAALTTGEKRNVSAVLSHLKSGISQLIILFQSVTL